MKNKKVLYTLVSIIALIVFLIYAHNNMDSYQVRILNLCAIYVILGLSMNLINGFTGLFSLGHAGFMAIGAYTTALLTMPVAVKESNFFMVPIVAPLNDVVWPFLPSLIFGGLLSAFAAFLIGAPALRLKGDYLAIATLGFGEIIRILITNAQSLTNGALGLKGIPNTTNLWWSFLIAAVTTLIMVLLINSSYGRAFKAIREDEIAAENMGINLFKHKMLAFIIGAFFAGIGGGLLGNLLGTVDPMMFRFTLTFNILFIIVLGGMGSITGTIISAFIVTISMEVLRFLDASINLGFVTIPGVTGMRMVVYSILLIVVIIYFRNGLMGTREFSWDKAIGFVKRFTPDKGGAR
ncbi:MAG: branched-chain amino acid ABC transporter permease [Bacillota bacterium]